MRFLADECLHVEIVAALRQAGHEVATVAPADTGASDEQVLERAARERAILRTADKDFGEIGVARAAGLSGIVLFGDPSQTPRAPAARLLALIEEHGDSLHGRHAVVTPARARLRRLAEPDAGRRNGVPGGGRRR
jgi:hypothetical protein